MDSGVVQERTGHYSAWRAIAALPAIVGSTIFAVIAFAALGRWDGVGLLGWVGVGALTLTRPGERLAVRLCCGFRRPSRAQWRALEPVAAAAMQRCGIAAGDIDWYVQHGGGLNAYATGRRTVAVTTGVLRDFQAGRVSDDALHAVLVHELGHHATRGTGLALVTTWLAFPWRWVATFVIAIVTRSVRRRRLPRATATLAVGVVVLAIVRAARAGNWVGASVLLTVTVCGVAAPLIDAAVSRASETAADRFAAAHGVGAHLADALHVISPADRDPGWIARLGSRHPAVDDRVDALRYFEYLRLTGAVTG